MFFRKLAYRPTAYHSDLIMTGDPLHWYVLESQVILQMDIIASKQTGSEGWIRAPFVPPSGHTIIAVTVSHTDAWQPEGRLYVLSQWSWLGACLRNIRDGWDNNSQSRHKLENAHLSRSRVKPRWH